MSDEMSPILKRAIDAEMVEKAKGKGMIPGGSKRMAGKVTRRAALTQAVDSVGVRMTDSSWSGSTAAIPGVRNVVGAIGNRLQRNYSRMQRLGTLNAYLNSRAGKSKGPGDIPFGPIGHARDNVPTTGRHKLKKSDLDAAIDAEMIEKAGGMIRGGSKSAYKRMRAAATQEYKRADRKAALLGAGFPKVDAAHAKHTAAGDRALRAARYLRERKFRPANRSK